MNIESRKSRRYTALKTWDHTYSSHDSESEYKRKDWIFYYKYCENSSYECQSSSLFWNHLFKKHDINIQSESYKIEIFNLLKLQDLYNKITHSNQSQKLNAQILK